MATDRYWALVEPILSAAKNRMKEHYDAKHENAGLVLRPEPVWGDVVTVPPLYEAVYMIFPFWAELAREDHMNTFMSRVGVEWDGRLPNGLPIFVKDREDMDGMEWRLVTEKERET